MKMPICPKTITGNHLFEYLGSYGKYRKNNRISKCLACGMIDDTEVKREEDKNGKT
mgnify:CR=1 FL=1